VNAISFSASGLETLTKSLTLCKPLLSETDVSQLKDWLAETWVNLAMVDYPYAASFLEPLPAWPIKVVATQYFRQTIRISLLNPDKGFET
jgi:lysosomal Pro-X carboxypeptidase